MISWTERKERNGGQYTKRPAYDKALKMATVKLASEENISVKEIAHKLRIRAGGLRHWMNEYDEYGESAFPWHGNALFISTYEIGESQWFSGPYCGRH